MQFVKEAAVILENHTLEIKKLFFPQSAQVLGYWTLKSIAVQTFGETVLLYSF